MSKAIAGRGLIRLKNRQTRRLSQSEYVASQSTLSDKSGGVHAFSGDENWKEKDEGHRALGGMMNFMQDKESAYDSAVPTRQTPTGSAGGEK